LINENRPAEGQAQQEVVDGLRWHRCTHEVEHPNQVRLIAESRKKADRVDAALLAALLRLGAGGAPPWWRWREGC
jgi:hypothetical protein